MIEFLAGGQMNVIKSLLRHQITAEVKITALQEIYQIWFVYLLHGTDF